MSIYHTYTNYILFIINIIIYNQAHMSSLLYGV